jgi:hypothetical protein
MRKKRRLLRQKLTFSPVTICVFISYNPLVWKEIRLDLAKRSELSFLGIWLTKRTLKLLNYARGAVRVLGTMTILLVD